MIFSPPKKGFSRNPPKNRHDPFFHLMHIIRVTVSEAAALFGVAEKTIRRAIARAEVTYVVVRGRYKINFESLLRWSQERPRIKNKNERGGIGQYVEKWRIHNRLYSPNPARLAPPPPETT